MMLLGVSVLSLAFIFESPGSALVQFGAFAIRWYGLLIASAVLVGVNLSPAVLSDHAKTLLYKSPPHFVTVIETS